jgi:hypothetical protein
MMLEWGVAMDDSLHEFGLKKWQWMMEVHQVSQANCYVRNRIARLPEHIWKKLLELEDGLQRGMQYTTFILHTAKIKGKLGKVQKNKTCS